MKIAFTVATPNYLAQAKTVADSFLKYNQDCNFNIVLIDELDKIDLSSFNNIQVVSIDDIQIPFIDEMIERYSIFELCNALKPFCADYFLSYQQDVQQVIYLDCDICVYNNFFEIDNLIDNCTIFLTPHILHPPPVDGLTSAESDFLNAGIYNGGFFAVKRSKEASRFLEWWKDRMRVLCKVDLANGLYVDQLWLNLVPLYFNQVKIVSDMGYNIAPYNLHERSVSMHNGQWYVNETALLVFFHFSGYNVEVPDLISKYQTRFSFAERPDLLPLCENYRNDLIKNDFEVFSKMDCSYYIERKNKHQIAEVEEKILNIKKSNRSNVRILYPIKVFLYRCKYALRVLLKGV